MIAASEFILHRPVIAQALAKEYAFDPFQIATPDILADYDRSLKKIIRQGDREKLNDQLGMFDKLTGNDLFQVFPTRDELLYELLPILAPLRDQFPFLRTGLSISNPVGLPGSISLNNIIRLYNAQKNICIKVKFSVFLDEHDRFYYEVGYVDLKKSVFDFEKNFLERDAPKGDYFFLQQLVEQVKKFIRRRPAVSGLDLTPAYYHVLPLCLRLGGKPQDEDDFSNRMSILETAAEYSLRVLSKEDPDLFNSCKKINRRYLISWLISAGKLINPLNAEILTFNPPRLTWKPALPA